MSFPGPDAKYSEIQAWEAAQRDERLRKIKPIQDRAIVPVRCAACAACGKRCDPDRQPLTVRTRIKYSAKYKNQVFEPGQILCTRHSTEALVESTETWHAFAGDEHCSAACRGWNGTDRRCDCGTRRVIWDTSTNPPFARAD